MAASRARTVTSSSPVGEAASATPTMAALARRVRSPADGSVLDMGAERTQPHPTQRNRASSPPIFRRQRCPVSVGWGAMVQSGPGRGTMSGPSYVNFGGSAVVFEIGTKVIYPSHGVAEIVGR